MSLADMPRFTYKDPATGIEYGGEFKLPSGQGQKRQINMAIFAEYLKWIAKKMGFKVSARGWCYQLEQYGIINKGQFNSVNRWINMCRKAGYLPIDFVATEKARLFEGVEVPTDKTPEEHFKEWLEAAMTCERYFTPKWWEGEEYYIQMLVEKIDLVTLFKPVCEDYHIPIATSKGWSSILQRAAMLDRFKAAEDQGLQVVLLYCGDHDPYGLAISDYMMKNLQDLYRATGYDPSRITIDRFGLNYDFIEELGLSWIDNLISGSGKRPKYDDPIIAEYIEVYGERKCEANALIVAPAEAEELCREAIEKYLGEDAVERFQEKFDVISKEISDYVESTGLAEPVNKILYEEDE